MNNESGEDKMADRSRRYPLFPICCWAPPKPRHRNPLRRSSLSCHFHPIVSTLDDNIRGLRKWHDKPPPLCGSPKWIAAGLEHLDDLLAALAKLLLLPQAQKPLRCSQLSLRIDRLADAHRSFRVALTDLKNYQTVAQIALRRNDKPRLASAVQSQRQVEKEFNILANSIRGLTRSPAMAEEEDSWEAEMAGIMREVTVAAAVASRAVMVAVAKVVRVATKATKAAACETRWQAWGVVSLWWSAAKKAEMKERAELRERERAVERRGAALDKMEELEKCVEALESSSHRVYGSLLNTRGSLLNFPAPSF